MSICSATRARVEPRCLRTTKNKPYPIVLNYAILKKTDFVSNIKEIFLKLFTFSREDVCPSFYFKYKENFIQIIYLLS